MAMMHWPLQSDADDFYGDPRGYYDRPDRDWEKENLVHIVPPWKMVDEDSGKPVEWFLFHKKAAPSLNRILEAVWLLYGEKQEEIEKDKLHLFSGSYVFRNIRHGHHLSMHSYGCAIDIASNYNQQGSDHFIMPAKVVKVFEDEGCTWGGRWHGETKDAMHFQFARVG